MSLQLMKRGPCGECLFSRPNEVLQPEGSRVTSLCAAYLVALALLLELLKDARGDSHIELYSGGLGLVLHASQHRLLQGGRVRWGCRDILAAVSRSSTAFSAAGAPLAADVQAVRSEAQARALAAGMPGNR